MHIRSLIYFSSTNIYSLFSKCCWNSQISTGQKIRFDSYFFLSIATHTTLLCLGFFLFATLHSTCDLVLPPGTEPVSPAVEARSLNHQTAREACFFFFFILCKYTKKLCVYIQIRNSKMREFLGGPVVKTWPFHCQGPGPNPGRGTQISQSTWCDEE